MAKWIEITTKIGCSSRCEYCPQSKLIKKYTSYSHEIYMSLDTYKKCLSTIPTNVDVQFTGFCEPFLNPLTMDFVEYAREKGHNILINTTLKGMRESDVDRIKLLIEKRIWPGPLTIHLPIIGYTSNIISERYYEILDYVMRTLGFENVRFRIHGAVNKEVDDFIRVIHNKIGGPYRPKPSKIHSRAGNVDSVDTSRLKMKNICPRIYDHVLLPNGDVVLCCVDYGLEVILGNLTTMTYEELHLTKKFKEIEKNGTVICRRCEY